MFGFVIHNNVLFGLTFPKLSCCFNASYVDRVWKPKTSNKKNWTLLVVSTYLKKNGFDSTWDHLGSSSLKCAKKNHQDPPHQPSSGPSLRSIHCCHRDYGLPISRRHTWSFQGNRPLESTRVGWNFVVHQKLRIKTEKRMGVQKIR